jgi:hypothetical protein
MRMLRVIWRALRRMPFKPTSCESGKHRPIVRSLPVPEIVETPKDRLFRIHRDARFSKEKTPYKRHAPAMLSTAGPASSVLS